jgi:hypothetical protein
MPRVFPPPPGTVSGLCRAVASFFEKKIWVLMKCAIPLMLFKQKWNENGRIGIKIKTAKNQMNMKKWLLLVLLFAFVGFGCNSDSPEENSTVVPKETGTVPGINSTVPEEGGTAPGEGSTAPEEGSRAPEEGGTAPEENIPTGKKLSEEDFPEWLLIKIREQEIMNRRDFKHINVWVYKGELNDRVTYIMYNTYWSCKLCEVYYENGEKVVWLPGYKFNFIKSEWELVYEYGEGLYDIYLYWYKRLDRTV